MDVVEDDEDGPKLMGLNRFMVKGDIYDTPIRNFDVEVPNLVRF